MKGPKAVLRKSTKTEEEILGKLYPRNIFDSGTSLIEPNPSINIVEALDQRLGRATMTFCFM